MGSLPGRINTCMLCVLESRRYFVSLGSREASRRMLCQDGRGVINDVYDLNQTIACHVDGQETSQIYQRVVPLYVGLPQPSDMCQ